jgi:hypothetical protein
MVKSDELEVLDTERMDMVLPRLFAFGGFGGLDDFLSFYRESSEALDGELNGRLLIG